MKIQSVKLNINKNNVDIRIGDGTLVYSTDVNSFEENSGVVIRNVDLSANLEGYYIRLKDVSDTFVCGNIIDNLSLVTERDYKNSLLIIDFNGVEEVTNSFFKSYTKFLLGTTNKIITINMSIDISNQFSSFINSLNIIEKEDEE